MSEDVKFKVVKPNKCVLKEDGYFQHCFGLDEICAREANASIKGLVCIVLTNFKTNKSHSLGVVYKKSAQDAGVILNFCPFCKNPIINAAALHEKELPEGAVFPKGHKGETK